MGIIAVETKDGTLFVHETLSVVYLATLADRGFKGIVVGCSSLTRTEDGMQLVWEKERGHGAARKIPFAELVRVYDGESFEKGSSTIRGEPWQLDVAKTEYKNRVKW